METNWRLLAIVTLSLGAAGCGDSGSSGNAGSCNFVGAGFCIDYGGALSSAQQQQLRDTACVPNGGTFSGTGCSGSDAAGARIGTCVFTSNGITQSVRVYPDGGLTAAQAQAACTSGTIGGANLGISGVWTNG